MNNTPHPMQRIVHTLMATCLAVMATAVFLNVVLRYGFGSSVPASEELSRLLFVWMVFLGAAAAYPAGEHMAFTSLIGLLRRHQYQTQPVREDYRLTPLGKDLYGHVLASWLWDRRWGDPHHLMPKKLTHRRCGHTCTPQLLCPHCAAPAVAFTAVCDGSTPAGAKCRPGGAKGAALLQVCCWPGQALPAAYLLQARCHPAQRFAFLQWLA